MTEASLEALRILRSPENLLWYVVPFFVIAVYFYQVEIRKGNWSAVLLGIYFFATSGVILEIVNALILHFTQYSALWTTPGRSAYVIYAGWNIEISFLAIIGGLHFIQGLPEDKNESILGIPNRIAIALGTAIFAVLIEVVLNQAGILVWEYKFWNWPHIYFMVIWWAIPYTILGWLHDNLDLRGKAITAVVGLAAAISCHVIFAEILGWV
jgi:hypothetical protein